MSDWLKSILLGIIEGVTEFVPISSTGHMLLAGHWMGVELEEGFWRMFVVFIQIGAILAVVVYFRRRILELLRGGKASEGAGESGNEEVRNGDPRIGSSPSASPSLPSSSLTPSPSASATATLAVPSSHVRSARPLIFILIATIPVLAVGYLVNDWVERNMESPFVIACAVGGGGVVMLAIELLRPKARTRRLEDMSLGQAIFVGLAQILAVVFPGTSRSAATIMGGMVAGLSRDTAAEFSFFLAIPAMTVACGYSLLKQLSSSAGLSREHLMVLTLGTVVSFIVAWIVIAAFMHFIRRYSFIPFAIYRIVLAILVFLVA